MKHAAPKQVTLARTQRPAYHSRFPCRGEIKSRRFARRETAACASRKTDLAFESGDILVVKHKIVSKAEGRIVDLATVKPSADSIALGQDNTIWMPA